MKILSNLSLVMAPHHDVKVAPDLIDNLDLRETKNACVDKGYDADYSERKLEVPTPKQIDQRNVILNPVITIWIGIYIKLDTELKIHLPD